MCRHAIILRMVEAVAAFSRWQNANITPLRAEAHRGAGSAAIISLWRWAQQRFQRLRIHARKHKRTAKADLQRPATDASMLP